MCFLINDTAMTYLTKSIPASMRHWVVSLTNWHLSNVLLIWCWRYRRSCASCRFHIGYLARYWASLLVISVPLFDWVVRLPHLKPFQQLFVFLLDPSLLLHPRVSIQRPSYGLTWWRAYEEVMSWHQLRKQLQVFCMDLKVPLMTLWGSSEGKMRVESSGWLYSCVDLRFDLLHPVIVHLHQTRL